VTVLDLSGREPLEPECARRLDDVAHELRNAFTELVDGASRKHLDSADWWCSELAGRNTLESDLFTNLCRMILGVRVVVDPLSDIDEVVVESPSLAEDLKRALANHGLSCSVRSNRTRRESAVRTFRQVARLLLLVAEWSTRWITSRTADRRRRAKVPPSGCTLLEVFVFRFSFDEDGCFEDRYYPGLRKRLTPAENGRVVYLPSLEVPFASLWKTLRAIRTSREPFFLPEDTLTLTDLWGAFMLPVRAMLRSSPKGMIDGIDVSSLLRETHRRGALSHTSVRAAIGYRVARRLGLRRAQVSRSIDWFENQPIDKGWNAGVRWHLPDTRLVGYQGYIVPRHYLCMYPTPAETEARVVPHVVAVCGQDFENERSEFISGPEPVFAAAPAFRFQHLWDDGPRRGRGREITVLFTLHLSRENAADVLRLAIEAGRKLSLIDFRLVVKPHPLGPSPAELAASLGLHYPDQLTSAEGPFDEWLSRSDVLVGNTSSTCVEALAQGLPVVIVGSRKGLTQNPIPSTIPFRMWATCFGVTELTETIDQWIENGTIPEAGRKAIPWSPEVKARIFHPVTPESVRTFLGLATP
jgi:hypothetical protein